MTNPYEAPQTVSPRNPNRWRGWVGGTMLVLSGLIALAALVMVFAFFKVRYFPRPGQQLGDHGYTALANFFLATILYLGGRWFCRRGQPPPE